MAKSISNLMTSKTPYSTSKFNLKNMKTRSDGRGAIDSGLGKPKPKTATDKAIHYGHIKGSGFYNLDHSYDHTTELAFDYKRLNKEKPGDAKQLQSLTIRILNRNFSQMGLKLVRS